WRGQQHTGCVIGLITVRQVDDLLAEEGLLVQRQHDTIGQDGIHERCTDGAGIDEVIDLHRRGSITSSIPAPSVHLSWIPSWPIVSCCLWTSSPSSARRSSTCRTVIRPMTQPVCCCPRQAAPKRVCRRRALSSNV